MASNAHLLFSIKAFGVAFSISSCWHRTMAFAPYGIEMSCEIYLGIEEMIYSVADHGDRQTGRYDGSVYNKEAESSSLLTVYAATDPIGRKPRHFSFVGGDYCYEVLGFSEPTIRAFGSPEEAYAWGPSRSAEKLD